MSFTLLIAGATGLIGKKTLELALADPSINKVIAPVRKKLPDHPKLEQWVDSDFAKALRPGKADAVICCLGTTIKTAGSKEAYNKVKGEMERDLFALQLPTLHIFHPSILKGPREAVRIGERIGIAAMSAFSFITPDNYKPMPYDTLAKALISASKIKTSGTYTYRKIFELAGR